MEEYNYWEPVYNRINGESISDLVDRLTKEIVNEFKTFMVENNSKQWRIDIRITNVPKEEHFNTTIKISDGLHTLQKIAKSNNTYITSRGYACLS